MSDKSIEERLRSTGYEPLKKKESTAGSRSKIITFLIIVVFVFGLMIAFLMVTNQNFEAIPEGAESLPAAPAQK